MESKINNKGALGEGIFMIYRILLVSFIAFIILGISSVFYAHYVDVRDAEAYIMAREVINCVSLHGVLNLDSISEQNKRNILAYCGFDEKEIERFFVKLNITDSSGETLDVLQQGDSGKSWVKKAFEKLELNSKEVGKYEPGYFPSFNKVVDYPIYVFKNGEKIEAKIFVEVIVSDEF